MKRRVLRPSIQKAIQIEMIITCALLVSINDFSFKSLPIIIGMAAMVFVSDMILAKYGKFEDNND